LAEQRTFNPRVLGSSPSAPTSKISRRIVADGVDWSLWGARSNTTLAIAQGSMRLFTYAPADAEGDAPIGVVGLSSIHPRFRTALLWYALGEPGFAGQGLTGRAAAEVVRPGFQELDLRAINAWVVDGNDASVRILENIGFQRIGRQRQCHRIERRRRDRLLFEIVSSEFARRQGRCGMLAFAHDASLSFAGIEGAILSSVPWG
jgi:RimJ/RimL family protein N-acetyltransferase